jgi:hypothetical protein
MKKQNWIFVRVVLISITATAVFLLIGFSNAGRNSSEPETTVSESTGDDLVILWTSGDRDVAEKMVFMYAFNAKKHGWFDNITMIVWGPSAKLLSEDDDLQDQLTKIREQGVTIKACKACADMYMVAPNLEELDIEVIYMGKELTDYLKGDFELLTI